MVHKELNKMGNGVQTREDNIGTYPVHGIFSHPLVDTVDGRNPANHLGCIKNPQNNGR